MGLSNSLKDIRKAIAEEAVNFLKGRMIFNQRFVVDKKEDKINFKSFISQYRKYNESIEFLRENQDKIVLPENKEMPIDDIIEIELEKLRCFKKRASSIVLTESEIDEFMGYIRESIENYGIVNNSYDYNENYFLRDVLSRLLKNRQENSTEEMKTRYKRISDFSLYIGLRNNQGFYEPISGRISCVYGSLFKITNHEFCSICEFDKYRNKIYKKDEEDICISDKMYIGFLSISEESEPILGLFLETIKNGKKQLITLECDEQVIDICNTKETTSKNMISLSKLNQFLNIHHLDFLAQDVYNRINLPDFISSFKYGFSMSKEKREKIDTSVEIAVNWWIENITWYDDNNQMDAFMSELNKFKKALENNIKKELFTRPVCYFLGTTPIEPRELKAALSKVNLDAEFPLGIRMNISSDEVSIQHNNMKEVLYKAPSDDKRNIKK